MGMLVESRQNIPAGVDPNNPVTLAQVQQMLAGVTPGVGGNSEITLGSLMKPMKDVWPAVNLTDGPRTADTGIVLGTPSFAGKTLYVWNSGVFNDQSMNWYSAPAAAQPSGYTGCMNASTSRIWNFGPLNTYPIQSNHDFDFISDTQTMTLFYYHYDGYYFSNYHDHQIYVELDGQMKKLTRMPMTTNAGSGLYYRTVSFKEAREQTFRVMLDSNAIFIGVAIDAKATIRKAPKKLFVLTNGDSWNEPNGNILAAPIGGSYPTGTYNTYNLSQAIAEATGWAVGLVAHGGTGEYNVLDGNAHDANYSNYGTTTFHGVTRVNDMATKFFSRNPIVWTIGGWNDGPLSGAPYRDNYKTRVLEGIDRLIAKKSNIKLMYSGIQPVSIAAGDARDLSMLGQADACAARPNNVIGFTSLKPMWLDTTTGGQRGANTNASDTIHLHSKGAELVANWMLADAARWKIPLDYYNAMVA